MHALRQCQLVLVVVVGWREGKVLGSEEVKVIGSGLFGITHWDENVEQKFSKGF
jgi:hypothetical protein